MSFLYDLFICLGILNIIEGTLFYSGMFFLASHPSCASPCVLPRFDSALPAAFSTAAETCGFSCRHVSSCTLHLTLRGAASRLCRPPRPHALPSLQSQVAAAPARRRYTSTPQLPVCLNPPINLRLGKTPDLHLLPVLPNVQGCL